MNYFLRVSPIDSSHLFNNIYLFKYTFTMTSDNIPHLEVNALSNELFLAINRIQHLWRQRANTNNLFKEAQLNSYNSNPQEDSKFVRIT